MKQEIIEYYFGDFVTPLGRPHLIIVGQEFDDMMRCEKYILFEKLDGIHVHIGEEINSSIIANVSDNLENFIENQGLEQAKSIIYTEAIKKAKKKQLQEISIGFKRINLRKSNQNSFLLYMKRRSEMQLNWIHNNTESIRLQELINLYKSFQIATHKIELN